MCSDSLQQHPELLVLGRVGQPEPGRRIRGRGRRLRNGEFELEFLAGHVAQPAHLRLTRLVAGRLAPCLRPREGRRQSGKQEQQTDASGR